MTRLVTRFLTRVFTLTAAQALIFLLSACGGGQISSKPIGIFVSPRNAVAWANSVENQIVYKVVIGYSDGRDVPLTTGLEWLVEGSWVSFNSTTATATCVYPAPQQAFLGPEAATIKATATIEGQTFQDEVVLDCF
jgi:hypothetical protein